MHSLVEVQTTEMPSPLPKRKTVAPLPTANPVPVIVTVRGPSNSSQWLGLTSVIVGARKVKRFLRPSPFLPLAVVTVTVTVPVVAAGDTAVIEVVEWTTKLAALVEPNSTARTPMKLVPVIVTEVPPAAGPLLAESFLTAGASPADSVVNVSSEP